MARWPDPPFRVTDVSGPGDERLRYTPPVITPAPNRQLRAMLAPPPTTIRLGPAPHALVAAAAEQVRRVVLGLEDRRSPVQELYGDLQRAWEAEYGIGERHGEIPLTDVGLQELRRGTLGT